jgi:hypothetical protein
MRLFTAQPSALAAPAGPSIFASVCARTSLSLLLVWGFWPGLAPACSVPVFRYALERWHPSPYQAFLFHRGPLAPAHKDLARRLTGEALSNQPPANLTLQEVDLDVQPPPVLLEMWQRYAHLTLPAVVVRFPRGAPAEGTLWAGSLTEEAVARLIDSPARKRLARSLVQGDSAVWLLLESGDQAKDDAAARLLETRLAHLRQTLKLPKIEEEDLASGMVSVPESALRVAFSLLRLSRGDAVESTLVHCLLGTEEDLRQGREIMAFPVFGRGRALCAVVGEGLTEENIDEASRFLIGPCSCMVKEENPGLDLLMAVDWDSQIRLVSTSAEDEPPPLTGFTAAAAATSNPAPSVLAAAAPPPPATNAAVAPPLATSAVHRSRLRLAMLSVLTVGLTIVIAGTFLLRRRHR